MVHAPRDVFCSKCGAQNPENAEYCYKCGNKLTTAPSSASFAPEQSPTGPPPPSSPSPAQGKSSILAAFLNLFFGLGYVYLGYRKVLGVSTVLFVVLAIVVYFVLGYLTLGIVTLILAVLLAIDGYQKGEGQKGFISADR